jgi:hypothetical protein
MARSAISIPLLILFPFPLGRGQGDGLIAISGRRAYFSGAPAVIQSFTVWSSAGVNFPG